MCSYCSGERGSVTTTSKSYPGWEEVGLAMEKATFPFFGSRGSGGAASSPRWGERVNGIGTASTVSTSETLTVTNFQKAIRALADDSEISKVGELKNTMEPIYELEVGDRVRVRGERFSGLSGMKGMEGTVVHLFAGGSVAVEFDEFLPQGEGHTCAGKAKIGHGRNGCPSELKLISKNKSFMSNLREKYQQLFVKEPQKSFQKAGITNTDETLTSEGNTVFMSWLLKENATKFKAEVVDPILEEQEKEKTK